MWTKQALFPDRFYPIIWWILLPNKKNRGCISQCAEGLEKIPRHFLFISLCQTGFVDMILVILRSYYLFSHLSFQQTLAENVIVEGENKLFSCSCHLSGFNKFSMASLICSSLKFLRHLWDIYLTGRTIWKFCLFVLVPVGTTEEIVLPLNFASWYKRRQNPFLHTRESKYEIYSIENVI